MQSYLTIDRGKAETVLFKMGLCLWIYIYIYIYIYREKKLYKRRLCIDFLAYHVLRSAVLQFILFVQIFLEMRKKI